MASPITPGECRWKNCPKQPVALAAMGTLPDQTIVYAYCQEHAPIIQAQYNAGVLHTKHGRVHEMLTQAIP